MNCREIEKLIYLYNELSIPEREMVDNHVMQCKTCQVRLEEFKRQRVLVRDIAMFSQALKNPGKVTHSIMRAIQSETPSWDNRVVTWLDTLWVKRSLAAVSLALILLFIVEQKNGEAVKETVTHYGNTTKSHKLNTHEFLGIHKNGRERLVMTPATSLYDCMKKGDCEEAFRRSIKTKKNYENI
jgi:hypothetical protein